jgi:CheY-like chemotaxis protein
MSLQTVSGSRSATVLVVEDEPAVRLLVCLVLRDEGYLVEAAGGLQQALDCACGHPPTVVVLDWNLPGVNGDVVADRLRAACGDDLPILLITTSVDIEERAERVRAYECLGKPFDLDALSDAVGRGLLCRANP